MSADSRVGIYPGTFDPLTNGHIDIITRSLDGVVDRLIIAVAINIGKGPLFSVGERVAQVRTELGHIPAAGGDRVEVMPFDNLLTDFAGSVGAGIIIRGLRAVSDFEYEFQMAAMNRKLCPELETVFLMASDQNQFIASRFVKEIGMMGGDVSHFVPLGIARLIKDKFSGRTKAAE